MLKQSPVLLLWGSFRRMGLPLSIVLGVVSVAVWVYKPEDRLPAIVIIPVGAALGIAIIVLLDAFFVALRVSALPRVVLGRQSTNGGEAAVCLLEPSELFSHGTAVSFYYIDEGDFEQLLGIGAVLNVQQDGRVQVALMSVATGQEAIVARVANNEANALNRTRVKPTVPSEL